MNLYALVCLYERKELSNNRLNGKSNNLSRQICVGSTK